MIYFIEFWKAKDAWLNLPKQERIDYVSKIGPAIEDLMSKGVQIDAWGVNDNQSLHKADFDFYGITKFPNQEILTGFENMLDGSGWYDYFEQVNVSGEGVTPQDVIGKMIAL